MVFVCKNCILVTIIIAVLSIGKSNCLRLDENVRISPEVYMNSLQLIQYNGYKGESHNVTTLDGYILQLHRIPQGREQQRIDQRPVVLIQHGLLADSACFVFNGRNASLGFLMADFGYDVWLGNSRGNTYSMGHVKYNPNQEAYWNFSWQDMAEQDLPTMVDYILRVTNQSSLVYIGHSQGTMIGFTGFSRNQTLAKQIKLFIALAPVARVGNAEGITKLLGKVIKSDEDGLFKLFGRKGFLLNSTANILVADEVCGSDVTALVCSEVTDVLYGPGQKDDDLNRIPVYLAHSPSGTSTRNMVHFAQELVSGQFQYYDFGSSAANMAHYNQTTAPLIDITKMVVPTALYSGSTDFLADQTDVKFITSNVQNIIYSKEFSNWNHVDFILGTSTPGILFEEIQKLLKH